MTGWGRTTSRTRRSQTAPATSPTLAYHACTAIPEENPTKTVTAAAALGALGEVPGLGAIVGAIQGVATAKARERDEEWWAMVAARVQSLEAEVKRLVVFDDPQFEPAWGCRRA